MSERKLSFDINWNDHIAAESRLCVFVGSGVSSGCSTELKKSPPGWESLIDTLANKYVNLDDDTARALELEERAELVDRARIQAGVSEEGFSCEIGKLVDHIDELPVRESNVHHALRDVNPPLIVTTNYDRIIERYLNGSTEPGYNVWTYPGRIEQLKAGSSCAPGDRLGDFLRSGEPLILKIHGGIPPSHHPDDGSQEKPLDEDFRLVLSYSSYQEAYAPDAEIPSLLRSIFSTHQVIFIGYSLRDKVLRDVMQSAGSLRGSRFRHVILQSPDSVVPRAYQEAFEDFYGVKVGTYSDHSKLPAGLHSVLLYRS